MGLNLTVTVFHRRRWSQRIMQELMFFSTDHDHTTHKNIQNTRERTTGTIMSSTDYGRMTSSLWGNLGQAENECWRMTFTYTLNSICFSSLWVDLGQAVCWSMTFTYTLNSICFLIPTRRWWYKKIALPQLIIFRTQSLDWNVKFPLTGLTCYTENAIH